MDIAFGGILSLSRVSWKSAYSRSNMKPKSIPTQARKRIEESFCWFQVLWERFIFLSFCMCFLSFSCRYSLICIHVPSSSFHIAFMRMFLSFCNYSRPFISFHFVTETDHWIYGLARERAATFTAASLSCIAKVIAE